MKRIAAAVAAAVVLGVAASGAAAQGVVHIAYPVSGATYTISPGFPMLPVSFSVTCHDLNDHSVAWGYGTGGGSMNLGKATFRGTQSVQFLEKFARGTALVWVKSDCGGAQVEFRVVE